MTRDTSSEFPELLSHLSHCAEIRSSGDKTKMSCSIVRPGLGHRVKVTEGVISPMFVVSLFPDGQPFQPIGLVMG